jgi:peptide subunit release factor 1 (eRF1)
VFAVVVDRAHARFFEITAAGATELTSLHSPAMRGGKFHSDRQGGPGWGEHGYHGRIREEERRHYGAVAEQLAGLERRNPAARLVLAGPSAAADALRRVLPAALTARVIGTARLNPTEVSPARVHQTAARLVRVHERVAERALMSELEEALGAGLAENGTRAVLRAIAQSQVRTLIVRSDVRGTGFRCGRSGRLVRSAADCLGEGAAVPVSDVVREAVADARLQRATVVTIRDPGAARRIDGMAALLRFRSRD